MAAATAGAAGERQKSAEQTRRSEESSAESVLRLNQNQCVLVLNINDNWSRWLACVKREMRVRPNGGKKSGDIQILHLLCTNSEHFLDVYISIFNLKTYGLTKNADNIAISIL